MTGKFKWTREIPPAPEWFDLDRGQKMPTENRVPITYDEVLKQAIDEVWSFIPHRCEKCKNGCLSFGQDDENGDRRDGYTFVSCSYCFAGWWEDDDDLLEGNDPFPN